MKDVIKSSEMLFKYSGDMCMCVFQYDNGDAGVEYFCENNDIVVKQLYFTKLKRDAPNQKPYIIP